MFVQDPHGEAQKVEEELREWKRARRLERERQWASVGVVPVDVGTGCGEGECGCGGLKDGGMAEAGCGCRACATRIGGRAQLRDGAGKNGPVRGGAQNPAVGQIGASFHRASLSRSEVEQALHRWKTIVDTGDFDHICDTIAGLFPSREDIRRVNHLLRRYMEPDGVTADAEPFSRVTAEAAGMDAAKHQDAGSRSVRSKKVQTSDVVKCKFEDSFSENCAWNRNDPIPASYVPLITPGTRAEVMHFVCGLWYEDESWELGASSEIAKMVVKWEVSTDPGEFIDDGWGPPFKVFKYALGFLDMFREFIPNDGQDCPDARSKISKKLDGLSFNFHISREKSCDQTALGMTRSFCSKETPIPTQIRSGVSTKAAEVTDALFWHYIVVCPEYLCAAGALLDGYLYEAARRYFYVKEGRASNVVSAVQHIADALHLGRFAGAVISEVAAVLLHEMLHGEFRGGHCKNNCCFQRLSLKYWCRVFSYLGLYDAREGINMDLALTGDSGPEDHSQCGELATEFSLFNGGCLADVPGRTGNSEAWSKTDSNHIPGRDWSNPPGCS